MNLDASKKETIVSFHPKRGLPERFWSAWKPGVQPEDPVADIELIRRSMVPCAPHVLLDQEDVLRVIGCMGVWAQIKRAYRAVGEWFERRNAARADSANRSTCARLDGPNPILDSVSTASLLRALLQPAN
jgi:hypothetical protein